MSNPVQSAYTNPSATASGAVNLSAPDLTRHPPRLLDKARAVAAGKGGEFHYNCPVDQRFFAFTNINPDAFMAEIKAGRSDSELLEYVKAHAQPRRHPAEIAAWSAWFEQLTPTVPDVRAFFNDIHRKNAPGRDDIATWCDWLELDDYVTYGGKP